VEGAEAEIFERSAGKVRERSNVGVAGSGDGCGIKSINLEIQTLENIQTSIFGLRWLGFQNMKSLLNWVLLRGLVAGIAGLMQVSAGAAEPSPLPALDVKVAFPQLKFDRALWMEEAPDGTGRIIVVEQRGVVRLIPKDRNATETKVFLDISGRKPFVQNEEGLLAFAFHPGFKTNGLFYIYYTQQGPKREVLSEFSVSKSDPDKGDPATERILLEMPHPYWNHNGGTLAFGPDGFLYLSTGDGGMGGDPHNVGQSGHHLLAKILRIDVDSRTGSLPYGIPRDNPFVGKDRNGNPKADPFDTQPEGVRPEIWAYGLRNVWRMSFDKETGELWAADVGQDKFEEVDLITRGGNYGWSVREGFHDFKNQRLQGKAIDPVIEYGHTPALAAESKFPNHSTGISITGGYVYRGKKIPSLRGVYVYGDFGAGTIWGLRYENGQVTADGELVKPNSGRPIASFGQDSEGELYVVVFDGKIYQLVEAGK
jgi:glucose/arabinose dehydrogenase